MGNSATMGTERRIFYTVKELARLFKNSEQAIRNAIKRGELRAIKRMNRLYVASEALAEYLKD